MLAKDVMVSPVITVKPSASVKEVAKLFLEKRISAAPVIDDNGNIVGLVSEGDLIHRAEAKTERRRSRWLELFVSDDTLADEYIKSHSRRVSDVMTRDVITAPSATPLYEIAATMEKNGIKRIPIVDHGRLIGIVSRANLLQMIASSQVKFDIPLTDKSIRDSLMAKLNAEPWARTSLMNVTVYGGIVELWGGVTSESEREGIRVAAETTPGVCGVNDHLSIYSVGGWY